MSAMAAASSWRTSSYSSTQTHCVEVAFDRHHARVRDTKARQVGSVAVTSAAWRSLREYL